MRNRRPSDSFTFEEKRLRPHRPRESEEVGGCGGFADDDAEWVRPLLIDFKEDSDGRGNTIRSAY